MGNLDKLLVPALTAVLSAVLLLVARSVSFRLLRKWAERAGTKAGDLVLDVFRIPSVYWCVAIGLYLGIAVSDIPAKYSFYLIRIIHVLVIFSITIATANVAGRTFRNYVQQSNLPIPTTGLVHGMLKGTILSIGLLIILSVLGISIAPLITALGVGGLAVALALQDTLANLFAGIHILIEKSVRVGDFIRLESGQEGYVSDITWRTTRILMPSNNMVVIPNNKLSQSIVTNYYLPERRLAVSITVGVSYSADPETVESILREEAKKAAEELPFLAEDPGPSVLLSPGFGENGLEFTVACSVAEFTDQGRAQHEMRKRIFARFRKEGIEIPFPQRTVHLRKGENDRPA